MIHVYLCVCVDRCTTVPLVRNLPLRPPRSAGRRAVEDLVGLPASGEGLGLIVFRGLIGLMGFIGLTGPMGLIGFRGFMV